MCREGYGRCLILFMNYFTVIIGILKMYLESPREMLVFDYQKQNPTDSDMHSSFHHMALVMARYTSESNQKVVFPDYTQASDSKNAIKYFSVLPSSIWLQSLSHCELITDDGIRHLGNGACAHDQLEVIELDNCPLITDASLEHLKSCHSLERIELYDCQQITRAGIKRLRVKMAASPSGSSFSALSFFLFSPSISFSKV